MIVRHMNPLPAVPDIAQMVKVLYSLYDNLNQISTCGLLRMLLLLLLLMMMMGHSSSSNNKNKTRCSQRLHTSSLVPPPSELDETCTLSLTLAYSVHYYENMTLFTKREVHNI